ncbi:endonuclease MutS2 [Leuconostocaceae bacterium ESL0958]|nr:endonuclease MutS2 [Leuconostocaceae bacterium ESL0958]
MNTKVLTTLEYDKVKAQLFPYLQTEQGRALAQALQPSADYEEVARRLQETNEAVLLDRLNKNLALPQLVAIDQHLQRLRMQAALSASEIVALARVLTATQAVANFFERLGEDDLTDSLTQLTGYAEALTLLPALADQVHRSIDEEGRILDTASDLLAALRRRMAGKEEDVKKQLAHYTRGKQAQYLSEPIVTKRSGRHVLPVKASYRAQIPGVVYDQSQSGLTYYIEPQAIVTLENELAELHVKEAAEEQRVLQELSADLAAAAPALAENAEVIGALDFANAKALLARAQQAQAPVLSDDQSVRLEEAWHPLLDVQTAVKNTIALEDDCDTLIITGPNTGGKTITIKTLGLLQLLAQSGFFITTGRPSKVAVFDEIFADIGDEQSIEQNLSTFSSHMQNIKGILAQTTDHSLVLFDELGAGTDPQEGAALAMAILDRTRALGAKTMATTHYPELKLYGYDRDRTENASMVFDVETLQPTYHLLLGVPGQSNALAIAERIGFDQTLLADAKSMVNPEDQQLNTMIQDLVDKRQAVSEKELALDRAKQNADDQAASYEEQRYRLEKEKADMLKAAKQEANQLVAKTKQEAERLVKEIRQSRLQSGQQQGASEQALQEKRRAIAALHQSEHLEKNKVLRKAKQAKNLQVGDEVEVQSYHQQGTLVKKHKNGQWEVQLGILKMLIDEDDLKKTAGTAKAQQEKKKKQQKKQVSRGRQATAVGRVQAKLDLRGVRYEAALADLDRYLDTAVLANLSSVEIIHGKGTGALREGVTKFLRTDRRVKDFHFASANAGGDGATIVTLR